MTEAKWALLDALDGAHYVLVDADGDAVYAWHGGSIVNVYAIYDGSCFDCFTLYGERTDDNPNMLPSFDAVHDAIIKHRDGDD